MLKQLLTLLCCVTLVVPYGAVANTSNDLPDIGNPANAVISQNEEYQLGRMIMHRLQTSGALLEDPEVNEYVQSLGHRLAYHENDSEQRFTFFVVDDSSINAFALPGGFIGIHSGLLLATSDENELASVLAHEIAHVTQRHIARSIQASSQTSLVTAAAVVAALVLSSIGGASGDTTMAAVAAAQAAGIQQQINFTRSNEYEADRVGMAILSNAGFDPSAMALFFETLQRRSGLSVSQDLEFLRTHPVTQNRVAEARNRAAQLKPVSNPSTEGYALTRERLSVLGQSTPDKAMAWYRDTLKRPLSEQPDHVQYGYGLALMRNGNTSDAVGVLDKLLSRNEGIVAYHIAAAQAQVAAGQREAGLKTFSNAIELFPRNVPLTMRYTQALIDDGQGKKAHRVMLDLINNVRYTTPQLHLLAMAASSAGDIGDAHYYMSEFYVLNGELQLALKQLQLALASPDLNSVQRSRFRARSDFIRKHLPERERRRLARTENDPP